MKDSGLKDWFRYFAPLFASLTVILGMLLRIVLLFMPMTVRGFSFWGYLRIFGLGAVNDVAFAAIALVPAFFIYSFMTDAKYSKPVGYIIEGLLAALAIYVIGFNDISDELGAGYPIVADILVVVLLACFSIKLFVPKVRKTWRTVFVGLTMLIYMICAVTIWVCEIVFWEEFAVRFNFIAVDYLVYTNEVIGNIVESYPLFPMFLGVFVVAFGICWLMLRGHKLSEFGIGSLKSYLINFAVLAVAVVLGAGWLNMGYRKFVSTDTFLTQLQENGCWDFLEAFSSNELDYRQFYAMLPEEEASALQKELCGQDADGIQRIVSDREPLRKNIVLITIESLSAEYLAAYGDTRRITPNIDTLLGNSLVFDNLFATGNRTVRGLEAVTACIPPSSGESLVKRPMSGPVFTTGQVLREAGYTTRYIYGGDAYFDNMETFFGMNGYTIVDRKVFDKDDITFANIWGVCDEDAYKIALKTFDEDYASGVPFFSHIMTVSNHRPYTYPEGRIEYEGNPMSRAAAVKYTDYAIGKFLQDASGKPWFSETVFVIIADHCASSAGKTSLPLEGYHIPALIYAPGFIEPARVEKLCSQIDVMPTLFSLLGMSYESKFYGQDVLSPDFRERAFMATYQDLGYYADGVLTVLSPVRMVRQFAVTCNEGWRYDEASMEETAEKQLREAQAYYQTINLAYAASN